MKHVNIRLVRKYSKCHKVKNIPMRIIQTIKMRTCELCILKMRQTEITHSCKVWVHLVCFVITGGDLFVDQN